MVNFYNIRVLLFVIFRFSNCCLIIRLLTLGDIVSFAKLFFVCLPTPTRAFGFSAIFLRLPYLVLPT